MRHPLSKEAIVLSVLGIGAAYQRRRDALGGLWDLGMSLLLVTVLVMGLTLDHKTTCVVNGLAPDSPIGMLVYHAQSKQVCHGIIK
jgi:hypothetical protein